MIIFVAINDEGDHTKHRDGYILKAFTTLEEAESWIEDQLDFGDWCIGELELEKGE